MENCWSLKKPVLVALLSKVHLTSSKMSHQSLILCSHQQTMDFLANFNNESYIPQLISASFNSGGDICKLLLVLHEYVLPQSPWPLLLRPVLTMCMHLRQLCNQLEPQASQPRAQTEWAVRVRQEWNIGITIHPYDMLAF